MNFSWLRQGNLFQVPQIQLRRRPNRPHRLTIQATAVLLVSTMVTDIGNAFSSWQDAGNSNYTSAATQPRQGTDDVDVDVDEPSPPSLIDLAHPQDVAREGVHRRLLNVDVYISEPLLEEVQNILRMSEAQRLASRRLHAPYLAKVLELDEYGESLVMASIPRTQEARQESPQRFRQVLRENAEQLVRVRRQANDLLVAFFDDLSNMLADEQLAYLDEARMLALRRTVLIAARDHPMNHRRTASAFLYRFDLFDWIKELASREGTALYTLLHSDFSEIDDDDRREALAVERGIIQDALLKAQYDLDVPVSRAIDRFTRIDIRPGDARVGTPNEIEQARRRHERRMTNERNQLRRIYTDVYALLRSSIETHFEQADVDGFEYEYWHAVAPQFFRPFWADERARAYLKKFTIATDINDDVILAVLAVLDKHDRDIHALRKTAFDAGWDYPVYDSPSIELSRAAVDFFTSLREIELRHLDTVHSIRQIFEDAGHSLDLESEIHECHSEIGTHMFHFIMRQYRNTTTSAEEYPRDHSALMN